MTTDGAKQRERVTRALQQLTDQEVAVIAGALEFARAEIDPATQDPLAMLTLERLVDAAWEQDRNRAAAAKRALLADEDERHERLLTEGLP